MLEIEAPLLPFLKWAGGKRWLTADHPKHFPTTYNTYVEPFLGSGSVFFHLRPERAILGDSNKELIAAYQAIKDDWHSLARSLRYRHRKHREDDDYYYKIRSRAPRDPIQCASRLIYLNRTCFNGIYRVNQQGDFNVPRGTRNSVVFATDDFKRIAGLLQNAELNSDDFEATIDRAAAGDFVFADPPYTVRHNNNGFRRYNEALFSWADQERLARTLARAVKRGAKILSTNADHESIRELYPAKVFGRRRIERFSAISGDGSSRRYFEEVLIKANL